MEKNRGSYPKEEVISILKEWASPVLIGIVGMLLWRDVTEMRNDVKLLLTQQSADRVKIEQLEDDVKILKNYVFTQSQPSDPNSGNSPQNTKERQTAIYKDEEYELVPVPKKRK
jgi:hypothetical protein